MTGRRWFGFMAALTFSVLSHAEEPAAIDVRKSASAAPSFQVYCDFLCPFCERFFTMLYAGEKYLNKHPNIEFKHLPLSSHKGAEDIARFFEAAMLDDPDQHDALIGDIYRFRSSAHPDDLVPFFKALSTLHKLNFDRISRNMHARAVLDIVAESKRESVALKVEGTPTLFYQGVSIENLDPEALALFVLERTPADPSGKGDRPD
jgi:protein-disulfide isomerase